MLLIRTTGEKLRSDPCRLILEVSQEADHLGQRAITTRGESVQTLQSIKLIYQLCSRTRAAWILFEIDGSMDGLGDD